MICSKELARNESGSIASEHSHRLGAGDDRTAQVGCTAEVAASQVAQQIGFALVERDRMRRDLKLGASDIQVSKPASRRSEGGCLRFVDANVLIDDGIET